MKNIQRKINGSTTLCQSEYDHCLDYETSLREALTDLIHLVGPVAFRSAASIAMEHYEKETEGENEG